MYEHRRARTNATTLFIIRVTHTHAQLFISLANSIYSNTTFIAFIIIGLAFCIHIRHAHTSLRSLLHYLLLRIMDTDWDNLYTHVTQLPSM